MELLAVPGMRKPTTAQDRILTQKWTDAAGVGPMAEVGAGTGVSVKGPSREAFRQIRATPGEVNIGGLGGEIEDFLKGDARLAAASGTGQGMLPKVVKNLGDTRIGAPVADASRGPGILNTLDQVKLENGAGALTPVNKTLQQRQPGIFDTLGSAAEDSGLSVKPLNDVVRNATTRHPPGVQAAVDQGGARELGASGVQGTIADAVAQTERAGITPSLTRDEIMTWRRDLGKVAGGVPGTREQVRAKTLLEALENAYRAGVGGADSAEAKMFDAAKAQHGYAADIIKSADPHETIPLKARDIASKAFDADTRHEPKDPLHKLTMALASRQGTPPGGFPRAAYIGMLAGVPAGGLGYSALSEEGSPLAKGFGVGAPLAAWGLLGSQTGRKYLMNEAMSPYAKEMMTKLLTSGALSTNR
jgi:hypothetical protein